MKKFRFICVNFNDSNYAKKFCQSLQLQTGLGVEFSIICTIVDNSTNDQDSRIIGKYAEGHSWIEHLPAPTNLGYFGGLNYGLEFVDNLDYDCVVICNNDLIFELDFCKTLASKQYSKKVFSVCPDVITEDGIHQNPHIFKKINWLRRFQFDLYFFHFYVAQFLALILRIFRPVKSSPVQPLEGCEIHMGIGACYVLTSEFLQRFAKLTYPHFLYGEEAYFSDQIHSAGGSLWFDPDLVVHHAESATLSKVPKRTAYEFARVGYPSYRKML